MNTAFGEVVNRVSSKLKGITHKLNGHFSFFNDDDLYQEALEHLWVDFNNGNLDHKTDSYILQGCYFHLKNYIRTNMDKAVVTSLDELVENDDIGLAKMVSHDHKTAEDLAEETLFKEKIKAISLTEREETVFKMLLDGMTLREAGNRLGISHVMVIKVRNAIRAKCARIDIIAGYQK